MVSWFRNASDFYYNCLTIPGGGIAFKLLIDKGYGLGHIVSIPSCPEQLRNGIDRP